MRGSRTEGVAPRSKRTRPPSAREEPADNPLVIPRGTAPPLDPQQASHRAILDHLPAAVYATDAEGRITYFNEAAVALWGRRPKLGEDWWCGSWRLYWPDGRAMAHDECPMAVALKTGQPVRGVEALAERPDGTRFPFLPCPTPLRDASGKLTGAVNLLFDITESRQTEALLRDSEARYRGIFRNARVSVWEEDFSAVLEVLDRLRAEGVTDLRAYFQAHPDRLAEAIGRVRVLDVNEFTVELFEAGQKTQLLDSLTDIFLPETGEIFVDELVALWEGRRQFESETVLRTLKGRRIDVVFTIAFKGERCEHTLVTILDVSAKKAAERALDAERQRFETLNDVAQTVASDLNLEHVVQTVTDVATELSGAKFGAFFYNVTNANGESLFLYALSGAPRSAFEKFGLPRNTAVFEPTFRGTGIVRCHDIRSDPRYGKNAPHFGMPRGHLPVVSYLAVPVVSRSGEVIGGLFFGHPRPGVFGEESELLIKGIAAHAAIAIDNARLHEAAQAEIEQRQRAEEAKELVLDEIKHRVKNTLALIQALVSQTFRSAADDEHRSFVARLQALAGTYDLLTDQNWGQAPVGDVVERALAPFREGPEQRVQVSGPEAWLDAKKSVLLALALHELATNAVKYGALSNDSGTVHLDWSLPEADRGQRRLQVEWRERGGPPVTAPTRKGFGTKLIEQTVRREDGGAHFDFASDGLECRLEIALG